MEQRTDRWARERLGDRAPHVRDAVVQALQAALIDAQDAQKVGKSNLLYPFGWTLAVRRYERITEALADMDGVELIKPPGSPHHLVLFNGNLLYPFRYAKDGNVPLQQARVTDRQVSGLTAELFQRFGPEASQQALPLTLFDDDEASLDTLRPALAELPPDTRLILIAFAANDRVGLINARWGEAELLDGKGHVRWLSGCYEDLPVSVPTAVPSAGPLASVPQPRLPHDTGSRFDNGAMPAVPLTSRTAVERAHSDKFPPATERSPETPKTDEESE